MAVQNQASDKGASYAPCLELFAITPSDSTEYDPPIRMLFVTVAGDVAVKTEANSTAVTIAVIKGQQIPAMITHVMSTNTTASVVGGR